MHCPPTCGQGRYARKCLCRSHSCWLGQKRFADVCLLPHHFLSHEAIRPDQDAKQRAEDHTRELFENGRALLQDRRPISGKKPGCYVPDYCRVLSTANWRLIECPILSFQLGIASATSRCSQKSCGWWSRPARRSGTASIVFCRSIRASKRIICGDCRANSLCLGRGRSSGLVRSNCFGCALARAHPSGSARDAVVMTVFFLGCSAVTRTQ